MVIHCNYFCCLWRAIGETFPPTQNLYRSQVNVAEVHKWFDHSQFYNVMNDKSDDSPEGNGQILSESFQTGVKARKLAQRCI